MSRKWATLTATILLLLPTASVAAEPRPLPENPTPAETWLVPWPTNSNPTSTTNARDAAPANPENLSTDQALNLYQQAQEARARRDTAVDQLSLLRGQLQQQQQTAQRSQQRAELAAERANNERELLNDLARSSYMMGVDPTLVGLLSASSSRDFTGVLTLPQQLQKAANYQVAETNRVTDVADAAQQTAIDDAFAVRSTEEQIEETRTQIIIDTRLAREYEAAYVAFINSTAGQAQVGPDGCPTETLPGVLRAGAEAFTATELCQRSVLAAATPQAAEAVKWAFSKLGAPYACGGVGRMGDFRFDCSSLVSRAYFETSGIPLASTTYAHSTRNMMPWDGVSLDPHYFEVPVEEIAPGDLLLFNSCTDDQCSYQHVTMAISDGFMLHTNSCGDVAHITRTPPLDGSSNFVVARRVLFLPGETALQEAFLNSLTLLSPVEEGEGMAREEETAAP